MTTWPQAKLGILMSDSNVPKGVAIIIGKSVLAAVTIAEVRRVLSQIDHLEVALEYEDNDQDE
jgi:hypothetical protein